MRFRYLLFTLMIPALLCCGKTPQPEPQPETATITAGDITVKEGQTASIGASTNSTAPITYASANSAVATVSSAGEVTGVAAGNTTVTLSVAAVEGKFTAAEKTISVTVSAPETATITAKDITVEEGQTAQIEASTNSTAPILYASADEAIATVSSSGEVTGVKAGNTTITLTVEAVAGQYTAAKKAINVTVNAPLPPEIKDGDVVLATNANVEKFLTDVHYPNHDYTFTKLRTWAEENGVMVCPGNSDRPQEYTIRWTPDPSASDVTATLTEPTREWVYTPATAEDSYVTVTNLLPNTHYTYKVTASGGKVLTEGSFETVGKVHQLFFRTRIRNCRDLGGWKTEDGKTVKYRMVYRGGRLEPSYLSKTGKNTLKTEGIKAQLDLRGHSDVLSESTLKGIVDDYEFCAPIVEEGYSQMLQDDKEKTRQCMQFIMDCVAKDKPVYFHCSLGRDRTGTVAMLTLGILGVPEGDISQEYELTQFAPHGYATSDGEKTKMTRLADYDGAAEVIWGYAGEGSFQDGVNKYLLEIGISQADIDAFKANMLQ